MYFEKNKMIFKKYSLFFMLMIVLMFCYANIGSGKKNIGNFLLIEIHDGIHYLFEADEVTIVSKGILHHYQHKNYYVLYGIDAILCDKKSIYFVLKDKRNYLIIDGRTNKMFMFYDINKFREYAEKIDVKIKDIDYIDNYLRGHPNNISLAKRDDCV